MLRPHRLISVVLALSLGMAGVMQSARAGVIGAAEVAQATLPAPSQDARARLAATLDRADVVAALQTRGVDSAEARARVAALSDTEAQWLMQQIDSAPAGASDFLGTVVFIFVLLLVTDILGFTKVFPFTRSIR
ncbi:MAG: hypothetical protein RJA44_1934 [Pseudomonadota bacterium]|jgi:hypothetical protein